MKYVLLVLSVFALFVQESEWNKRKVTACTVTAIAGDKQKIVTLTCPTPSTRAECVGNPSAECRETILDIPEAEWPEVWEGPHTIGSKYFVQTRLGKTTMLGSPIYCKKELDRRMSAFDMEGRGPINALKPAICMVPTEEK